MSLSNLNLDPIDPLKTKSSKGDRFDARNIKRIATGAFHSLAVGLRHDKSQVFAWGQNSSNVLGVGEEWEEVTFPMHLVAFEGHDIFEVSCGTQHSLVLTKKPDSSGGKLYSFGLGNHGRLGYVKDNVAGPPIDPDIEESWFADKPYRVRFEDENVKIARICCGSDHSLALNDHGELFAFGLGQHGVLGLGNTASVWRPRQVQVVFQNEDEFVMSVAAGGRHSLCCTRRGHVWSWGNGGNGRLGHGDTRSRTSPELITALLSEMVVFVAAGESHSCAIDRNGRMYTWGQGSGGKLGHGDEADHLEPLLVSELEGIVIVQAACGGSHTLALTDTFQLYTWGSGFAAGFVAQGQLQRSALSPVKLVDLEDEILSVAAGMSHSLAITVHGNVLSWGRAERGRLGHADQSDLAFPKAIAELRGRAFIKDLLAHAKVVSSTKSYNFARGISKSSRFAAGRHITTCLKIACGKSHSLVLTGENEVYGFGSNVKGQLGIGDRGQGEEFLEASKVNLPSGVKCRSIAAGDKHSVFVTTDGDVYVTGAGDQGQLGLGQPSRQFMPVKLSKVVGCIDCACGADYTALLVAPRATGGTTKITAGDIWTFGSCEAGKLGHPSITADCILTPKRVILPALGSVVSCGASHMAVVLVTGEIYTWGAGSAGRLGNGNTHINFTPGPIIAPPNTSFMQVACGSKHTVALTTQNVVYVWGAAPAIAAIADITVPTNFELQLAEPEGSPKIVSIYAGDSHSAVISNVGRLYMWGCNGKSQIGGHIASVKCTSTTSKDEIYVAPVMIENLEGVEIADLGIDHTLVATRRGEVFAWGSSDRGKLGIGQFSKKKISEPRPVIVKWAASGSGRLAHAISQDHTVLTFGVDEVLIELQRNPHPSFDIVQLALQSESVFCSEAKLLELEEDLIKIFGRHLEWILSYKTKAQQLNKLQETYRRRLGRIQLLGGLLSPLSARILNPTIGPLRPNGIRHQYTDVIDRLRAHSDHLTEAVTLFVLQPAYFVQAADFVVKSPKSTQAFLTLLCQIYSDFSDSRSEAFFLAILRGLGIKEVENCTEPADLFDPNHSLFATTMSFSIMNSTDILHLIAAPLIQANPRAIDPGEIMRVQDISKNAAAAELLIDLIAFGSTGVCPAEWIFFTSTEAEYITQLSAYEKRLTKFSNKFSVYLPSAAEPLQSPKALSQLFEASQEFLDFVCRHLITNELLMVPNGIMAIFRSIVIQMQKCDMFTAISTTSYSRWKSLLRAYFIGVLAPLLEDVPSFVEFLGYPSLDELQTDQERVLNNISFIGRMLRTYINDDFSALAPRTLEQCSVLMEELACYLDGFVFGYETEAGGDSYDLKSLKVRTNEGHISGPVDFLDIQLTLSFYLSHIDHIRRLSPVMVEIDWWALMHILNLMRIYESQMKNLSTFDPMVTIVRAISEDKDVPFLESDVEAMLYLASMPSDVDSSLWVLRSESYSIDPAFLHKEKNIVFDPSTKAPVPQRLAFRQRARTNKGEATLSLIQRITPTDENDPRKVLQEALREAPSLDAKSFTELAGEFKGAQDLFSRKDPPDYNRAALMEKASEVSESMAGGESRGASRHFMFWACMQVQLRREHHRYLERLKRADDLLNDMERELEDEIRDQEKVLHERILELETLTVDSTQATICESTSSQPYMWQFIRPFNECTTASTLKQQDVSKGVVSFSLFCDELTYAGVIIPDPRVEATRQIFFHHANVLDLQLPWQLRLAVDKTLSNTFLAVSMADLEISKNKCFLSLISSPDPMFPKFYAGPLHALLLRSAFANTLPAK